MDIVNRIRDAGIVGEGGAGFPTHVKMNCRAEWIIANGAECEPLLRVDQQVMQHDAPGLLRGMRLVMQATGAKKGVVALKDHYTQAIDALRAALKDCGDISLHIMKSYYPAGDEQQIVYAVTGKVVPTGGLPLDVGVVISNVSTLVDIARAGEGIPFTEKFVTVGGAVHKPCTLRVPVGASAREVVEYAGGAAGECDFIIGGPCMGKATASLDFPVTKTTGGILAIPKGHPLLTLKDERQSLQKIQASCCQCSFCTQMCPRNALGLNVTPHKAMRAVAQGEPDLLGHINGIFSCCDCGICTYHACNFGLKPHHIMRSLKAALAQSGVKPRKEVFGPVDPAFEMKKLPTSRLMVRLGIAEYDLPAPMRREAIETKRVCIPLKMHVGAPSVPVVTPGQKVKKGELIAEIRENALGARIHASIGGSVARVTETEIEIKAD